MNRKLGIGAAAVVAVVLVGAWALSPVFAVRALTQAAKAGDEAALRRLVDFPAFRDSLKDELNASFVASMRDDPRASDGGLSALGMLLAPALVSGAVDAFVTPQAIAAMVETAEGPQPARLDGSEAEAKNGDKDIRQSWAYRDLNTFAVTLSDRDEPGDRLALLMERRGLFGWELAGVDLDPQEGL
jgi:hypothetical protein